MLFIVSCDKSSDGGTDPGTGGSMARFTIKGDYLYTVDNANLRTFNISQPSNISYIQEQYLGFGIETIFPSGNHLFIGSRDGMYIYELTNPQNPKKISYTPHFVSYDPVVVQGNYAYVTLRTSPNDPSFGINRLLIFDITKLNSPEEVASYNMVNPKGLGIEGDKLFICDDVLKVFNVTNGYEIELIQIFDIQAIDVVPIDGRLYVVCEDGFYQYNYDGDNITFLSKITIPNQK